MAAASSVSSEGSPATVGSVAGVDAILSVARRGDDGRSPTLSPDVLSALKVVHTAAAEGELNGEAALEYFRTWVKDVKRVVRDSRREDKRQGGRRRGGGGRGSSRACSEATSCCSDPLASCSDDDEDSLSPRQRRLLLKQMRARQKRMVRREKAELKLQKAVGNLWRLDAGMHQSGSPASPDALDWDAGSSTAALQSILEKLDEAVCSRPHMDLQPDDQHHVQRLGQTLALCALTGGDPIPADCTCRETTGVMSQIVLFKGKALTVRLHLFPEMAETYTHNHKSNFASFCVYGQYKHTTWTIDAADESAEHYSWSRGAGGELSSFRSEKGRLVAGHSFMHSTGETYFINRAAYHTVGETGSTAAGGNCLTLFVKGNDDPPVQTKVLAPVPQLPDVQSQQDHQVTGKARDLLKQKVTALLRIAGSEAINERLHALS
eukprot:TRINITY_DN43141_c0_g1_i1.p1 TRINITY_DN43141_c0_g1~~TRINITY_DN43141_c0_g1_i1.p1  ORF type:complete len:459 (+),score=94.43 TRINITY_DN43141_c0_g1_i1:74-1378(+)